MFSQMLKTAWVLFLAWRLISPSSSHVHAPCDNSASFLGFFYLPFIAQLTENGWWALLFTETILSPRHDINGKLSEITGISNFSWYISFILEQYI